MSDGYRVLISSTGSAIAAEIDLLQSLQRGYADGLIISPLRIDEELVAELGRLRIPAVVIGNLPRSAQVDNVRANSAAGMRLAVRHLADLGRRRIGFINGPLDTTPGQVRGRAFLTACRQAGVPTAARHRVVADDFTFEAGAQAAHMLLDRAGE